MSDAAQTFGAVGLGLAVPLGVGASLARRSRARRLRTRVEHLVGRERIQPARRRSFPLHAVRRWAAPLGAATAGFVVVEDLLGAVLGLFAAYAVWRRQRGRDPGPSPDEDDIERQLPLAADLLAACVSAGAGPREAAEAVGDALGGPVGEQLIKVAAQLRLGGEPVVAWGGFARIPGAAALARCMERADLTGAPAAESVSRLAERLRADQARMAVGRGRTAQVLITAPVGLCFLPAFLAVGVAPVVIGLAGGLLNGN
ncbi:type II secretion system F family protein [Streptomyces sp. NPDC056500]|uniref:type II secretion system F family protein n=1 Tax=Streptomyces sp. NPDC056500 TaxID=3345840 RepID=UPI0036BF66A7